MSKTVHTYRALKDLKMGDSIRGNGELVPEASDWPNVAVWIREGHIESTTCTQQEMDEFLKSIAVKKTTEKKKVVKKSAAKKKIIKKKGKSSAGRELSEQSV
jgi:hypothetical protein